MASQQPFARAASPPREPATGIAASFELAGWPCHIVHVDEVVPTHDCAPGSTRARLSYLPNEVAHFQFGSHRYALVADAPAHTADDAACPQPREAAIADIHARLTNRELQIVQLICMGLLTKQVADRLRISEFTVRSYLKTVYCKLGVRSRGAMVYAYAKTLARVRPGEADPDDNI